MDTTDITAHIHLFLRPEHVNLFIRFILLHKWKFQPELFEFILLKNMTYPLTVTQAWPRVWQVVSRSMHICVLSLGIVHLRYNAVITVSQAVFPPLPPGSPLFSPAISFHHNKPPSSLSLYPVLFSLSRKNKQALVEQPHSLAPLAGQLSHKTSWCYGNSHFTVCAAQLCCKNRFNCYSKG